MAPRAESRTIRTRHGPRFGFYFYFYPWSSHSPPQICNGMTALLPPWAWAALRRSSSHTPCLSHSLHTITVKVNGCTSVWLHRISCILLSAPGWAAQQFMVHCCSGTGWMHSCVECLHLGFMHEVTLICSRKTVGGLRGRQVSLHGCNRLYSEHCTQSQTSKDLRTFWVHQFQVSLSHLQCMR
jgi:hypothetical protein